MTPSTTKLPAQANDISPAQQAFAQALNAKINQLLSSKLDGTFSTVNYPEGLNWAIQSGDNNYYNQKSLNEIDLQLQTASNDILSFGGSNFSSLYLQVLNDTAYNLSSADKKTIQDEANTCASEISAVISSYESDFAPITDDEKNGAIPPNKLGYIESQVATLWNGDISQAPASVADFVTAYQSYQVAAAQSNTILQASAQAMLRLKAARNNTKTPTAKNGGLQTGDKGYYAAYTGMPSQNDINSGLQDENNSVSLTLSLSNFSSSSSDLSVDGGGGISVSVADIFGVSVNGSSQYDLSKYSSSGASVDMTIKYSGVTIIGATPLNLDSQAQSGWYDNEMLTEAVANMGQDVTGFQLQGSQFSAGDFGPGGKLSRLKTFVISQLPTIDITFHNSNNDLIKSDFQEQASADVTLFDFIDIGGGSESYEVQNVSSSSSDGSVTISLSAPTPLGVTLAPDSTAFVMGGVPSYPPNKI